MTTLISESVEPRPQLILAVAAHEQRLEIEQLDLAVAEAAHRADGAPCVDVNAANAGPKHDGHDRMACLMNGGYSERVLREGPAL